MTTSIKDLFEQHYNNDSTGVQYKNMLLKKKILTLFASEGNITLGDLSKLINISIPKTGDLVNELVSEGLARDYGKTDARVGRRPNLYGLDENSAFFVGVEVKGSHINIGLMNFDRSLIKNTKKIPYDLDNSIDSLHALCTIIRDFIDQSAVERDKILGIGVNLTGRINYKTGHSYSFFNFHDEPLSKTIEKDIGIHTYLENDSRAMAYGEFCMGLVKNEQDVLFINFDEGIGMGIMFSGQLYYGKSGFAGEFGHTPSFNNEIICHCGKKGCLETEASGKAMIRIFKERLYRGESSILTADFADIEDIQLDDIISAANRDDTLAIELTEEIGEKLGKSMATLVNIFNPELIIIGGALAKAGDYIKLPIKKALNKYSINLVNKDTELRISQLGEDAGVIGACLLVRERILAQA